MKRVFTYCLGLVFLFSNGCAAVRSDQTACQDSPCLTSQSVSEGMEREYSPAPRLLTPPSEPQFEEEIPPSPPASLDVTVRDGRPARKPIAIPLRDSAVRLANHLSDRFKD